MYKLFIILSVLVVLVLSRPDDAKYTTKYDDVDIDAILANPRLYGAYIKCLLDEGPCTPDGQELRDVLDDALQSKCNKCSEKQKAGIDKVIKFIVEKNKGDWERLKKKYDPENKYVDQYKDLAAKSDIKL